MAVLRVEVPAAWLDCLACAGGRALARKGAIWMRSNGESCAIFDGAELLAVAYLVADAQGRREFCLALRPPARTRMRRLCRLAHSTLAALSENGAVIFCRVMAGNRSGARMAALCGFHPSGGEEWTIGEGGNDEFCEGPVRRRRQERQAGGGTQPPDADGGE